jgi:hypothetical protein
MYHTECMMETRGANYKANPSVGAFRDFTVEFQKVYLSLADSFTSTV